MVVLAARLTVVKDILQMSKLVKRFKVRSNVGNEGGEGRCVANSIIPASFHRKVVVIPRHAGGGRLDFIRSYGRHALRLVCSLRIASLEENVASANAIGGIQKP